MKLSVPFWFRSEALPDLRGGGSLVFEAQTELISTNHSELKRSRSSSENQTGLDGMTNGLWDS